MKATTRPFRILLIDDIAVEQSVGGGNECTGENRNPLPVLQTLATELSNPPNLELLVSTSVKCDNTRKQQHVRVVLPTTNPPDIPDLDGHAKFEHFLSRFDVLILDLGEVGELRKPKAVTVDLVRANLRRVGIDDTDIDPSLVSAAYSPSKSGFSGIGFYHLYLDQLRGCKAVFILTQYDKGPSTPEVVKRLIDPFCDFLSEDAKIPWTVKLHKEKQLNQLKGLLRSLYEDFSDGYANLTNRGAIEFAATNDLSVLIVGESGTGKEYIAKAIHRAWVRERRITEEDGLGASTLVTVNCAGLSPELGRSELFGHVSGSFTGATDHRVGAVLLACGCKGFKSSKKSLEEAKADNAAYEKVSALLAETAKLDQMDNARAVEHIKNNIDPKLKQMVASDFRSVLSTLRSIFQQMQAALSGSDLVNDYFRKLLGTNSTLFEETTDQLGLRFKPNRPVGTLFLDEFGDLPSPVQNLLLRFLEEKSGEIQPVGYPARIANLKVRLIVATSDPRVAEFAGAKLSGSWRSREELERPLRQDLLGRVKHIVIRAEPLGVENFDQCLSDLLGLDEKGYADGEVFWDESAKDALRDIVKQQTIAIRTAQEQVDKGNPPNTLPVFGHRRELQRIITLANSFVKTARDRGLRGASVGYDKVGKPVVTRTIVEKLWKPASISASRATDRPFGIVEQMDSSQGRSQETTQYEEECRKEFSDTLKRHVPSFKEPWTASELERVIKGLKHDSEEDRAVRLLFEKHPGKGKQAKARVHDFLRVIGFAKPDIAQSNSEKILRKKVKDWRKDWWSKQ